MTTPPSRPGHDADVVVPVLVAASVLAVAGPALLATLDRWGVSWFRDSGLVDAVAAWWDRNWWLVAFWAVALVALAGYRSWLRRRTRDRRAATAALAGVLGPLLPPTFDPDRHLRVLDWHGVRPARVRLDLVAGCRVADATWRQRLADAAGSVLGPLAPVRWPADEEGRRGRLPQVQLLAATMISKGGPDRNVSATDDDDAAGSTASGAGHPADEIAGTTAGRWAGTTRSGEGGAS